MRKIDQSLLLGSGWNWIKVIFWHLYWHESAIYWEYHYDLSSLFTELKAKKKRGEEKTDQTALYTPKYSAENKLDFQCLSAPSLY